jgi:hypothetical protein
MPAEREIMLAPQKVTRGNTAADFPDPLHNNPIMPSDGRQQFGLKRFCRHSLLATKLPCR